MEVNEKHVEYNAPPKGVEYTTQPVKLKVFLEWNQEAEVWIATSDDVPCLVLESPSCDALMECVRLAALELIKLNGKHIDQNVIIFQSREPEFANG